MDVFLNLIIPKGWICWNADWNPGVSGNTNPAENSKVFQGISTCLLPIELKGELKIELSWTIDM